MGSENVPPCGEGVNHFILETPIRLNQADIDLLKSKSYDNTVEGNGNAREVILRIKIRLNLSDLEPFISLKIFLNAEL